MIAQGATVHAVYEELVLNASSNRMDNGLSESQKAAQIQRHHAKGQQDCAEGEILVKRVFAVGAVVVGNASQYTVAKELEISPSGLSKLISSTKAKADASGLRLWGPVLSRNKLGRGRLELLSQAQKTPLHRLTTQDREHLEEEP
jgi:hypothetical protein